MHWCVCVPSLFYLLTLSVVCICLCLCSKQKSCSWQRGDRLASIQSSLFAYVMHVSFISLVCVNVCEPTALGSWFCVRGHPSSYIGTPLPLYPMRGADPAIDYATLVMSHGYDW